MIKLAALGALGYFGYRYFQKNRDSYGKSGSTGSASQPRLAGGPLSDSATLSHSADMPSTTR